MTDNSPIEALEQRKAQLIGKLAEYEADMVRVRSLRLPLEEMNRKLDKIKRERDACDKDLRDCEASLSAANAGKPATLKDLLTLIDQALARHTLPFAMQEATNRLRALAHPPVNEIRHD